MSRASQGITAHLESGRINQKARTRDALIAAAVDMLREGQAIAVKEVADRARVGRATAYRYFPNLDALTSQAAAALVGAEDVQDITRTIESGSTVEGRVAAAIQRGNRMTLAHEREFRAVLREALQPGLEDDPSIPRRPHYRKDFLCLALAPAQEILGAERTEQLTAALSLLVGIESWVVLHDMFAMAAEDANDLREWAAQALLHAALEEAKSDGKRGAISPVHKKSRKRG